MTAAPDGPAPRAREADAAMPPPLSFEECLGELNDIVARLESGGLGLAASITDYERGVALLGKLHAQLADVEERVRMLVRIDEEGRPVLEPPGGSATAAPSGSDGRREPRSAAAGKPRPGRPKRLPGMDEPADEI